MTRRVDSRGLRQAILILAAAAALCPFTSSRLRAASEVLANSESSGNREVRALWVVRTTLTSPAAVDTMVTTARASGFNTLLVQVRGLADTSYASALEQRPFSLAVQPAFDPLALVIERAHRVGLTVHAWFNVNRVAGANELPTARDHIVYRHPEWLMVPRALAADLADVDPTSPQYLGRLSRYARSRPDQVEGLYLSPMAPGAADFTANTISDFVTHYNLDGVHLDHARYPTEDFDYSREALAAFRRSIAADLTPGNQQTYDRRLAAQPLLYTQAFPERWRNFRAERLTQLVVKLRDAVRAARPSATVSAAVEPDAVESLEHRLQDWRGWLDRDLIDVVCPMAYTRDAATFAAQVAAARAIAGTHPIWAGIGAHQLSSTEIVANVQAARRLGVGGIVLFSYDSLTDPTRGPEYLAEVGRALFLQ